MKGRSSGRCLHWAVDWVLAPFGSTKGLILQVRVDFPRWGYDRRSELYRGAYFRTTPGYYTTMAQCALSCTKYTCYTTDGSANDILAIKWTTYNHILTTPEYVPPALTLIAVAGVVGGNYYLD